MAFVNVLAHTVVELESRIALAFVPWLGVDAFPIDAGVVNLALVDVLARSVLKKEAVLAFALVAAL